MILNMHYRTIQKQIQPGYINKLSVADFENEFRLAKTDYRIHFALNCGAKSCPPVTLYVADKLDQQLDRSAILYLKSVVTSKKKENEVNVPKLCYWFKADFGGEKGVIKMLHRYKIFPKRKILLLNTSIITGTYRSRIIINEIAI